MGCSWCGNRTDNDICFKVAIPNDLGGFMREQFAKLIDVKSIITIILTGVFAYLSIFQIVQPDQFMTVFTVVIAFYFGTQYQKGQDQLK